jgi:tetratricopeptide (TPR) repeat protein
MAAARVKAMRQPVLIAAIAGLVGWCAVASVAAAAAPPEQAGPPAAAAPPPAPAVPPYVPRGTPRSAASDEAMYEHCMGLTKSDPAAARDYAERWQSRGGEHPADHCYALALIGLKQYKEGATRLESLATAMVHAPDSLRAEALDQAAQAWLLANDPARAYAAESAALNILPNDPDILLDRAEAAGSEGWYDKAVDDLTRVLKASPARVEALVYRATAYRELGRLDDALSDIDRAVNLSPTSVSALLERGDIRRLKGDVNGARQDWVRVSELAPGSDADQAAKANIERLELKQNPTAPAQK